MTHELDGNFVPRAPRFEVTDLSEAVVTVTRKQGTEEETFDAKLIDVSQHGTKLLVPVNCRFEETLQIKIEVVDTDIEYHGVASVRHIRASEQKGKDIEEGWLVGCAIAPPLSDEAFAYLATTSGTERRQARRLPVAAKATVRRQAQTERTPIALHNLSSGGFCFSSTEEYEVGERVQLYIANDEGEQHVIESRICWQIDDEDGYIAGCQFSSRSSYTELCSCLKDQPALESPSTREEPTSKLVLASAVLAMFVPPMMTLMLQANKVSARATTSVEAPETTEMPAPVELTIEAVAEVEAAKVEEPIVETPIAEATVVEEPVIESPQQREWIDNTGKHRTQAKLVDATEEHVVLLKSNGKRSTVPWNRLSEADQEYVRQRQSREQ